MKWLRRSIARGSRPIRWLRGLAHVLTALSLLLFVGLLLLSVRSKRVGDRLLLTWTRVDASGLRTTRLWDLETRAGGMKLSFGRDISGPKTQRLWHDGLEVYRQTDPRPRYPHVRDVVLLGPLLETSTGNYIQARPGSAVHSIVAPLSLVGIPFLVAPIAWAVTYLVRGARRRGSTTR